MLHQCSRYDLRGKEILKAQEKFYLADVALRYSVLGYNADSVVSSLENIVYLELCRRGYAINVGKTGEGEIDFVATRQNEKIYVQVTQEISSERRKNESMTVCLKYAIIILNIFSRLMNLPEEIMRVLRQCT